LRGAPPDDDPLCYEYLIFGGARPNHAGLATRSACIRALRLPAGARIR